jgi:hypothetical protein
MREYNLGEAVESTLRKLKEEGLLSTQKFYSFKSISFRPLLKHFENVGKLFVNNEMLKEYLEKQHDIYEGDRKQAWRWQIIRRSTELVMYFEATGRVDLPPYLDYLAYDKTASFFVIPSA